MEGIGLVSIGELQTRINNSLLMDSKTKEYLSMVVEDSRISQLVEEYLNTCSPYEVNVLEEINPKITGIVRQGEKWIEGMERRKDAEEAQAATVSLQYI